jgi:peptidoglycan/xylan/chitin deacetylase (PgdA/CDA1 family)
VTDLLTTVTGVLCGLGVLGVLCACVSNLTPQLYRWRQVSIWRRQTNAMALTYDDGPDPLTTVPLLNLLDEFNVKVTFYLVGFRAEAFPEIVRQIQRRGHEVGSHSYSHFHAWRIWPWVDLSDVERGHTSIANLIGDESVPFRPPYGKVSLPTLLAMRLRGRRVEWWSAPTNDTADSFRDPQVLSTELVARREPVVLMHSLHEEPHRREYMLSLTRALIVEARRVGMEFVMMRELAGIDNSQEPIRR